ncbi:hypothetical protein C8J56DRAFT_881350 [Mycena floridula]|nr:hypothetical protein C8J56DRAFT_881350 [Mycena floridula]
MALVLRVKQGPDPTKAVLSFNMEIHVDSKHLVDYSLEPEDWSKCVGIPTDDKGTRAYLAFMFPSNHTDFEHVAASGTRFRNITAKIYCHNGGGITYRKIQEELKEMQKYRETHKKSMVLRTRIRKLVADPNGELHEETVSRFGTETDLCLCFEFNYRDSATSENQNTSKTSKRKVRAPDEARPAKQQKMLCLADLLESHPMQSLQLQDLHCGLHGCTLVHLPLPHQRREVAQKFEAAGFRNRGDLEGLASGKQNDPALFKEILKDMGLSLVEVLEIGALLSKRKDLVRFKIKEIGRNGSEIQEAEKGK